jgi:predicted O-linked N-acetylglucosamine transferase (SPINDLY family)
MGFSGFNTALQAVECSLPIVTREGRFLRGRLASGILRRMGMPELVAKTEEEYVDLAVKLGLDAGFRRLVRERIESARHVLFHDLVPVRALEKFLIGVTGQPDAVDQALTSTREKA